MHVIFRALLTHKRTLPLSAASLHIEYPMLFRASNTAAGRTTHCGVLEFVAQEGHVYLPRWVRVMLLMTTWQCVCVHVCICCVTTCDSATATKPCVS